MSAALLAIIAALAARSALRSETTARLQTLPAYHAFTSGMDRVGSLLGFALTEIHVTGHRLTPDADIFDAAGAGLGRSLIGTDMVALRRRIERLPWVEAARIERVWPQTMTIRIVEKRAAGRWLDGDRAHLLDANGRILSTISAHSTAGDLLDVTGEGAAAAFSGLRDLLASFPAVAERLRRAERIGERRWTLELIDGSRILLPARDEGDALQRWAGIDADLAQVSSTRAGLEIDLRLVAMTRFNRRGTPAALVDAAPAAAPIASISAAGTPTAASTSTTGKGRG